MPKNLRNSIIVDKSDAMWIGWLARLVVSSLVTALGAKIIDELTSDCYCNVTVCYRYEREYRNAVGIYGYSSTLNRFVIQKIDDYSVDFYNMSIPFFNIV